MGFQRAGRVTLLHAAIALAIVACGDDDAPVDMPDATTVDSGADDGGGVDAGTDAARPDAGDSSVADGPVVTAAAPGSVARGSTLVLDGERLASAALVTIGGVEQTIGENDATSITIDEVAATTPTGTQPVIVTTAAGSSAGFDVVVLEPLAVTSAVAASATSVVVTFTRAPDPASLTASSFDIAGLTVSAAAPGSGTTVTLTTAAQTPAGDYELEVARSVSDEHGNALTGENVAAFLGFEPAMPVVTSIAPLNVVRGATSLTLTGSSLTGATVTIGGQAQTVGASSATEIVIPMVASGTPLGAQPVVATVGPNSSTPIDVNVLEPFRILGATATSSTTVELAFNRAVDAASATVGRFTLNNGLTASAASTAGAVVTLTTSPQTAGATYQVTASAMVLDTLGFGATTDGAAFTGFVPPPPTEFVVVRVGTGTAALAAETATAVFLERRSIATGAVSATLAMPTAMTGGNHPLVLAGTAIAEGDLILSRDGRQLAITGYGAAMTDPPRTGINATSNADVPRVVGVITADDFATPAGVDTTTTLGPTAFTATRPHTALVDGTTIWVGGGFGGLWTTTIGASTATQVTTATIGPSGGRALGIFGGQLYYTGPLQTASDATTPPRPAFAAGLYAAGTGLPTAAATSTTAVVNDASVASPYSFAMFDLDPAVPGLDRLYIAVDDSGIKRFRRSGGTWVHDPATDVFGPAVRRMSCFAAGSDVTCVASAPATLYRMVDTGGSSPGGAMTSIGPAPAMTAFRGVAFAPVP